MKVIIAGSRDIPNDLQIVEDAVFLAEQGGIIVHQISEVVCGMAKGVDLLGFRWAVKNLIPVKEMPADWDKHGKAAGPIRNRRMAEYAEGLIAIWDGESRGTKNMIEEAKKRGLPTYIHYIKGPPLAMPVTEEEER